MTPRKLLLSLIPGFSILLVVPVAARANSAPVPVSPSGGKAVVTVDQRCPTFIWGDFPGAESFELAVYRAEGDENLIADPVVRVEIPASAHAWVPPVGSCLEPSSKYAWTVRALRADGASEWSEPSVFAVGAQPSFAEVEAALETLHRYRRNETDSNRVPAAPAELPALKQPMMPSASSRSVQLGAARGAAGSSDISIDGLYLFANPVTGFYRIPGSAFVTALDDSLYKVRRSASGYSFVASGPVAPYQATMVAEVHLPAFSEIVSLTCSFRDDSNTNGLLSNVSLRRRAFDSPDSTLMAIVGEHTTPAFRSADILSDSTSFITDPIIFNSGNDYFVHVTFTQDLADPNGMVGFYGCAIRYLYSILLN